MTERSPIDNGYNKTVTSATVTGNGINTKKEDIVKTGGQLSVRLFQEV